MSLRDSMMARFQQLMQERQAQDQATLANAAQQPIPGLTGPTTPGQIPGVIGMAPPGVGMAPPQQPLPGGQALQPFMANGPYGQQALQLAGLTGGQRMGNHMQPHQGLLGAPPKGYRMPYRPVGK